MSVRCLVANRFPQWAHLPLIRVPSAGTDNAMYRLGADLVVRLPRMAAAAARIGIEQKWLPRLAPYLPVAVPELVATAAPADGFPYPWSVYRWLDGADLAAGPSADLAAGPGADLADAAVRLGRFVAVLRRLGTAGAPPSSRGGPVGAHDAQVRARIAALAADGTVDAGAATATWRTACAAAPWTGAPVWLHGDLHPANLLARGGRLAAVIDFGVLGTGDPACDMLPAWTLLTAASRELFRAAADVDDATWLRGRGWGLHLGLGAVHVYRRTNPVLAATGRHAIVEAVADHAGA